MSYSTSHLPLLLILIEPFGPALYILYIPLLFLISSNTSGGQFLFFNIVELVIFFLVLFLPILHSHTFAPEAVAILYSIFQLFIFILKAPFGPTSIILFSP
jgi:hypothetical protein